ncbi:MAG: cobyrinic acid a,c-diamide synthase [Acidobacteria bacterium]|nr:MAG: cobyrinic acid a,c-diamide synthase [Acidobacteriota bacterium]
MKIPFERKQAMVLLTSYNMKGGVGKTAAAVNLAYLSAQQGFKTLICDLDPQGAASFYFRVDADVKKGYRIFLDPHSLDSYTKASNFPNLYVLPADFSYRKLDAAFEAKKEWRTVFLKKMRALRQLYDVIIIDSPPNLTLTTEQIFLVTDTIISPIIPTTLSLRTLGQLKRFISKKGRFKGQLLPFFSLVESRKKLHRQIVHFTHAGKVPGLPNFLKTWIPYLSEVEKMGTYRAPLVHVNPGSRASKTFTSLWNEIKKATALEREQAEN